MLVIDQNVSTKHTTTTTQNLKNSKMYSWKTLKSQIRSWLDSLKIAKMYILPNEPINLAQSQRHTRKIFLRARQIDHEVHLKNELEELPGNLFKK